MSGPLRVLSLGAGVQSTTLLLLALEGELPRPDLVVFADTQWEPQAVYRHLGYLEGLMAAAGIRFERVTAGNLREQALRSARDERRDFPGMPLYGDGMLMRRQCTTKHKQRPIRRAIAALVRAHPGHRVEQWLGISLDELQRTRTSDVRYITNRYPLIERRMTRTDCLAWLERAGYPRPPRSACVACPFRSNAEWRDLTPAEFADAVEFDAAIRTLPRIEGEVFVHRDRVPLPMVDLSTEQERGQQELCGV